MITPNNDNIFPVGKRLLVETFKQAEESSEGLELGVGDGYATSVLGTVVRAGDGCMFTVGDILMWRRYSVDNLKVYTKDGEKEYSLIEENEVIAQVKAGGVDTPKRVGDYKHITEKQNAGERSKEEFDEEKDGETSPKEK